MKSAFKLELREARAMVAGAIRKAEAIGVLETVCVTDEGGYPILLERMDGARITGPQIAWNKAFTAAGHKRSTHLFNQPPNGPALPGNEAFGIQWSFEGRFAVFVGGFPIVLDGEVVGGIGLSGGNGEQDTVCGLAGLQALQDLLRPEGHHVLVEADIRKWPDRPVGRQNCPSGSTFPKPARASRRSRASPCCRPPGAPRSSCRMTARPATAAPAASACWKAMLPMMNSRWR